LLFITNITDYSSDKYNWKSYPVQIDSLAIDIMRQAGKYSEKAKTVESKNNSLKGKELTVNSLKPEFRPSLYRSKLSRFS